ncbi:MAG: JAB domain-containing protein, partial [Desulfatiglandaceae bacterium]
MERLYLDEFPGTKYRTCLIREESDGDATDAPAALHNSEDVFELVKAGLADKDREMLVSILLDIKNVPLGVNLVSIGDLSSSIVSPREVFKPVILASAAGIVLA